MVDKIQFKTRESDHAIHEGDALVKFITPATILLVGQSNSGKSRYIANMVKHGGKMFTTPPSRYVWLYNMYQSLYEQIENEQSNVTFVQGLPTRSDIEQWAKEEDHLVLIVDDMWHLAIGSPHMVDLFLILGHHMNVSTLATSHNIFLGARFAKTLTTNTHYILLFKLNNRLQLATLANQLYVYSKKARNFVALYDSVMSENKYSPLVIDLSPLSKHDDYKLRSDILPGQLPKIFELE